MIAPKPIVVKNAINNLLMHRSNENLHEDDNHK